MSAQLWSKLRVKLVYIIHQQIGKSNTLWTSLNQAKQAEYWLIFFRCPYTLPQEQFSQLSMRMESYSY